jgi:hypothetical protein
MTSLARSGGAVPGEAGYQDGYQLAGYDYQRVRM